MVTMVDGNLDEKNMVTKDAGEPVRNRLGILVVVPSGAVGAMSYM